MHATFSYSPDKKSYRPGLLQSRTGPQTVLVVKLTTFVWSVYDGRRSPEVSLPRTLSSLPPLLTLNAGVGQMATPETSDRLKIPIPPRFPRYILYFPGFLVSPFLEYAEYDALVTEKLFNGVTPLVTSTTLVSTFAIWSEEHRTLQARHRAGIFGAFRHPIWQV